MLRQNLSVSQLHLLPRPDSQRLIVQRTFHGMIRQSEDAIAAVLFQAAQRIVRMIEYPSYLPGLSILSLLYLLHLGFQQKTCLYRKDSARFRIYDTMTQRSES